MALTAVPAAGNCLPVALQGAAAVVFQLNIPAFSPLPMPALTAEKRWRYLLRQCGFCTKTGLVAPGSEEGS
jgi:hypothetical protein